MNHLTQIQQALHGFDIDALLVTGEAGEAYAIGFRGEGVVLVTEGECCYYTDSRYEEAARSGVTGCTIRLAVPGQDHRALAAADMARLGCVRVGFEDDVMTVRRHSRWVKALPAGAELIPACGLLRTLRARKDPEELERMEQAQRITDRTFQEILNHLRPGVEEREIAALITYYHRRFGAEGDSFSPIVASGPNGSMPHAIPTERTLRSGEFVTMDFGCRWQGYCSDMTRTVAIGQPGEEMVRVYETVAQAQRAGIAAVRAGVMGAQVHETAAGVIAAAGYGDYFGHGFGHSLGVEIHEDPGFRPSCQEPIPAGAVVSAEPGIYLPGRFGVRIEDVVVVEEGGCRILTRSPKELITL